MTKAWSIRDFALIWFGGLVGGALLGAVGLLVWSVELATVLGLAGGLGVNVALLALLYRRKSKPELGLALDFGDLAYLALGLAVPFAIALIMTPLVSWLRPEGGPIQETVRQLASPDTPAFGKVAVVVAAVFIAPVIEEVTYRGVLLKALIGRGGTFAILVTAGVFSAVHVVTLTDPDLASATLLLLPLFLLGTLLAWVTVRSGRLGPAIFTHMGFNTVQALVILLPTDLLESLG